MLEAEAWPVTDKDVGAVRVLTGVRRPCSDGSALTALRAHFTPDPSIERRGERQSMERMLMAIVQDPFGRLNLVFIACLGDG